MQADTAAGPPAGEARSLASCRRTRRGSRRRRAMELEADRVGRARSMRRRHVRRTCVLRLSWPAATTTPAPAYSTVHGRGKCEQPYLPI